MIWKMQHCKQPTVATAIRKQTKIHPPHINLLLWTFTVFPAVTNDDELTSQLEAVIPWVLVKNMRPQTRLQHNS